MPPKHLRHLTQDIAKALAIFAVVYGHVWRGLVRASIFSADHPLNVIDYVIYAWHMQLFFMLSGYNSTASLKRLHPKEFVIKRARLIIPIYIVWSLFQGLFQALKNHSSLLTVADHQGPDHVNFSDLPLIFYKPIDQFWFLYALMAYHILAALTVKRPEIFAGIAIVAFMFNEYADTLFREEFLYHMLFYVGGMYVARMKLPHFSKKKAWQAAVATGLLFVSFLVIGQMSGMTTTNPLMLPATVGGLGLVMAGSHILAHTKASRPLAFAGVASLAIFVTHVFFTAGCRTLLLKMHIDDGYLNLAVGTVAGVAGPIIVYTLLDRMRLRRWSFMG